MLSEIVKGLYYDPFIGTIVRATGDEECALFPPGTSPVDGGFKIDYEASEVVEAINDAEEDENEEDETGDETDEDIEEEEEDEEEDDEDE